MAKMQKVIVSERAVIARINRKLAKNTYEVLKISRSGAMREEMGRHYMFNRYSNRVIGPCFDPEGLARDLGVMQPYEQMEAGR